MSAERLRTIAAGCLLVVTVTAVTLALTTVSQGSDNRPPSTKPRPYGLLLLGAKGRFPVASIPKVSSARQADRLQNRTARQLEDSCSPITVDLGDYCLEASPHVVPPEDAGKADFLYATKACATSGGWLPSAAELLGAANRVKLAGTIDQDETTASVDIDPTDGFKDRREMSSSLVVIRGGSASAGSEGVTVGSRGNSGAGEPDPVPQPADPLPESLQYVTVYDNHDKGGFAGSEPVAKAEIFRCTYPKTNRAKPDAG